MKTEACSLKIQREREREVHCVFYLPTMLKFVMVPTSEPRNVSRYHSTLYNVQSKSVAYEFLEEGGWDDEEENRREMERKMLLHPLVTIHRSLQSEKT